MIRIGCILARGDHAARCAHCRRAAAQDRAIRAIAAAVPAPALSPRLRDQAFAAALARPAPVAPARWRRALVPAGAALAAAAVLAVVVVAPGARPPPRGREPSAVAAGVPVMIGHGLVTLAPGGMAWRTGDTEVLVIAGRLEVEVDPAAHREFRVRTPAFVVDVIGTVFSVDLDGVVVTRGAVRVSLPGGAVVVDRLAAGQRWRSRGAVEEDASYALIEMIPEEAATMNDTPDEPIPTVRVPARKPPPPEESSQALYRAARSQLSGNDVAAARASVKKILAGKPSRPLRASAELLLAESYAMSGEIDTAITHYLGIADRYRDLAGSGDAALYRAASLEQRAGHVLEAKKLFQAYLARYPSGGLADHARAQLRKLESR